MKSLGKKLGQVLTGLILATGTATAAAPTVTMLNSSRTVGEIINEVITWVLGFSGAIAVLFIIYGGLLYVTSAGNDKRIETAKKTLTFAIIGLIVIMLAGVIVVFVGKTLNQIV